MYAYPRFEQMCATFPAHRAAPSELAARFDLIPPLSEEPGSAAQSSVPCLSAAAPPAEGPLRKRQKGEPPKQQPSLDQPEPTHPLEQGLLSLLQPGLMQGARGPFALVHGQLSVEVLAWLQQEVLQDELDLSFERKENNRRLEGGVKVEISGHLVSRKREQASLNGLDAGRPLPLSRVFAFTQSFKDVNQEALKKLTQMIKAKLRPLTAEVAASSSRGSSVH